MYLFLYTLLSFFYKNNKFIENEHISFFFICLKPKKMTMHIVWVFDMCYVIFMIAMKALFHCKQIKILLKNILVSNYTNHDQSFW